MKKIKYWKMEEVIKEPEFIKVDAEITVEDDEVDGYLPSIRSYCGDDFTIEGVE